ncbi:MAG: hypothetical protein J5762_02455 [Clostridia bacterium]|nr:hypothetical protein [Clostridia bacterium]
MAKYRRILKIKEEDDKLPSTRKELFRRMIKDDAYLMIDLSLAETLFSLPLYVVFALEYAFLTGVEPKAGNFFPIIFYMGLAAIICWGIKYVGRGAAFSVMKKRVHNEGCFITAELLRFIKTSGPKCFFAGVILGVSAFVAFSGSAYLLMLSDTFLKWTATGVLILQFALFFGAAEFFAASESFYELKFFSQFKNSFSLAISGFFAVLLHFFVYFGIKFTAALFSPWAAIVAVMVCALYFNGLSVAVATLYAHRKFDIYINQENYPEYVDKGLLKKKEVE